MKSKLETFINHLHGQDEVRVFVDVKADGTGHVQASLDLAERLRQFGYKGQITFVLGQNMLTESSYSSTTNVGFNDEWPDYKGPFEALLDKRNPLGNIQIIGQDMVTNSVSGKILRKIISGETDLDTLTETLEKNDIYLDMTEENFSSIPNIPDFTQTVDIGFSGAADDKAGALDDVIGARCCIALQPTGWEKGTPGIWYKGKLSPFSEDTLVSPLCSIDVSSLMVNAKCYLQDHQSAVLKSLLSKHVQAREIVVLYNASFMNKTVSHIQLLENLQKCFSNSKSNVLFIDLHSSTVPSLCSGLSDKSNDELGFDIVKLADLTDTLLPDLSIIQCDYLPTPICDYLLKKASLVVCEGQGMAQKALLVGTPCLHSPKNSPHAIYESAAPLHLGIDIERGATLLQDATWHITREVTGDYMAQALNDCFHSSVTSGFCKAYSKALTIKTDRFALAIEDTVTSKKIPKIELIEEVDDELGDNLYQKNDDSSSNSSYL